jgi:JHP726-like protein
MITYIEKLLNGQPVEWKTLGEVAEIKRGTSVTKKTVREGQYPVISGGQKPAYYIDSFNREGRLSQWLDPVLTQAF